MNNAFTRAALAVVGLLVAAIAAPPQAEAQQQQQLTRVRFQLDWRFDGQISPFLMAQGKGYFRQEGLDVQFDAGSGSALAVSRTASGAYDMGYGDTSALIEFLANNPDNPAIRVQAVFMVLEATPASVMTMRRANVKTPKDLVGKTLGAPVFDAGRKMWPMFARANGIDPNAVKWQTMEPALREQMLVRGQVDGVTGFMPSGVITAMSMGAKEEDLVVMLYKDYGVKAYGNAILANPRFVEQNPRAIAGFLRAYTRALKEAVVNPEEAVKYVKERDPLVDVATEVRRFKGQVDQFIVTPTTKSEGFGHINKLRLESQVEDVVRAFGLKVTPNPDQIFNSSFLPERSLRRF